MNIYLTVPATEKNNFKKKKYTTNNKGTRNDNIQTQERKKTRTLR